MAVRAKFVVTELKESYSGSRTVRLDCRYDETIPEDKRFFNATPSGHVEMMVNNPAAIEQFTLGKAFYADFTPAD